MRKVILSENQIKKLVDKLMVTEQNEVRTESLTVPLGSIWPMGYWKLKENQVSQLRPEINKITGFISKHEGSIITIQIVAGESRVTNVDNEDPSKPKLASGVLSQKRGEQMVKFLTDYFQDLVSKNIINKMPEIPQPQTKIGTTPYNSPADLKNPKYTDLYQKEQFVQAIITTRKDYECLVGMEITIGYFRERNSTKHYCDEAIFELRMNGVSLGIANLNNGTLDIISSPEISNEIKRITDAQAEYIAKLENAKKSWLIDFQNGKIKEKDFQNPEKRSNYIFKLVGEKPFTENEYVGKISDLSKNKGYKDYMEFINKITQINDSLNRNNRQTDNKFGGDRSQTFILDGVKAKSIIDNAPAEEIILSIVPLVSRDSEYGIFYEYGSHTDTPWVMIKSKKSKNLLFNNEPNVKLKRGSTEETILLRTDLCGNQPKNKTTPQ
jgi:hypothetical protein